MFFRLLCSGQQERAFTHPYGKSALRRWMCVACISSSRFMYLLGILFTRTDWLVFCPTRYLLVRLVGAVLWPILRSKRLPFNYMVRCCLLIDGCFRWPVLLSFSRLEALAVFLPATHSPDNRDNYSCIVAVSLPFFLLAYTRTCHCRSRTSAFSHWPLLNSVEYGRIHAIIIICGVTLFVLWASDTNCVERRMAGSSGRGRPFFARCYLARLAIIVCFLSSVSSGMQIKMIMCWLVCEKPAAVFAKAKKNTHIHGFYPRPTAIKYNRPYWQNSLCARLFFAQFDWIVIKKIIFHWLPAYQHCK